MKVAQGNSIQYRNKTSYAGLNKDGLACGMLVNDDNVKIFLLDNDEISVNAHEIPLDDDAEQTQQDAFRVQRCGSLNQLYYLFSDFRSSVGIGGIHNGR